MDDLLITFPPVIRLLTVIALVASRRSDETHTVNHNQTSPHNVSR